MPKPRLRSTELTRYARSVLTSKPRRERLAKALERTPRAFVRTTFALTPHERHELPRVPEDALRVFGTLAAALIRRARTIKVAYDAGHHSPKAAQINMNVEGQDRDRSLSGRLTIRGSNWRVAATGSGNPETGRWSAGVELEIEFGR